MTETIERAQHSTVPIEFRIERGGAPVLLSGATVTMYLIDTPEWDGADDDPPRTGQGNTWLTSGTVVVDGGTCTVDADQTTNPGIVSWTPTATDLDTVGWYRMQLWVVFADGSTDAPPAIRLYVYPTIKGRA